MKMILTKPLFTFILGAILFSGISVAIAFAYVASDVDYSPDNDTWQVDNVGSAIDDLRRKYNNIATSSVETIGVCSGNSTSCSSTALEIGKAYLCVVNSRKYNGSFSISGANVLYKNEESAFLNYAYSTYRAFIIPTSSTVGFTISNSNGMTVVCYYVTNIE